MTFNIALNTIIYIMVFLFPGVLFRRFYYLGSDKNQFNHGHLLERFLITILLSILILASFFLANNYLMKAYGFSLVFEYSYQDFICLFSSLGSSIIPPVFHDYKMFEGFAKTFGLLYFYSAFFGWFSYNVVRIFHLDNWISALRFSNEWQYLLTLPARKIIKRKPLQRLNAQLDLLTRSKSGDVLYQGFYHSLVFNKNDEIDSIVLTHPKKFIEINKTVENKKKIDDIEESIANNEYAYFKYRDYQNKVIYKKHINSHSFVISKKDIVNINLLYIKDINTKKIDASNLVLWTRGIRVMQFVVIACAIVFPFINIETSMFDTFWNRLLFSVITATQLSLLINLFSSYLHSKYFGSDIKEKKSVFIWVTLSFFAFYLTLLCEFNIVFSILAWLIILSILSYFFSSEKKDKQQ